MACTCITDINARLEDHTLDTGIVLSAKRGMVAQTLTDLHRRDTGKLERRSGKPHLFAHTFCPFCGIRYEQAVSTPGAPGYASLSEMRAWAEGVMQREHDFVIGDAQLLRWWVLPRNEKANVYLHSILKSDEDRAMHDHPWANVSYLISGSYIEHTPEGTFIRKAGDVIERPAGAMHRLEVIPGERAISLFMTGPKVREWGFDCEQGWVHWQDFVSRENQGAIGRGCGEHGALSPVTPAGQPRAEVVA